MEDNEFRLSINTKTIILIILLLNVGYAYKKICQYKHIKETGFIRERTVQEQIQKRIMKSFGSMEEMDSLIADIAKQKEDADKLATTIRKQEKQIIKADKELDDIKSKHEEEKAYLHKKIRSMADGFAKRKDQYKHKDGLEEELEDVKSKLETEKVRLQKKIRDLEDLIPEYKNQ